MKVTTYVQPERASREPAGTAVGPHAVIARRKGIWPLALLLTLFLAAASAAQQDLERPFGTPVVSANQVTWQADPGHRALLTVSGPDGAWFRKEFAAGDTPWIDLEDLGASSDGEVNYSLNRLSDIDLESIRRGVGAGEVSRAALRRAEAELSAEERVQSGGFYLISGAFSDPSPVGPGPQPEIVDGRAPRKGAASDREGLNTKSTPLTLTNEDLVIDSTDVNISLSDTDTIVSRAGDYSLSIGKAGHNDLAWRSEFNATSGVYPFVIQNSVNSTSTANHNALVIG